MPIAQVVEAMRDQPWGATEEQGRLLYDFVLEHRPERILELGAGIGTSACYMASALSELGSGKITSIDINPDLPEWIDRTFAKVSPDARKHHELIISATSYNDELMWMIEAQIKDGLCHPIYDFIFIDGAHTWEIDACAFFLAEKLLMPGCWMLFDDLNWTLAGSPEAQKNMGLKRPPDKLQETPQVTKIFDLLVAQHPNFENLTKHGEWGWAQKRSVAKSASNPITDLYRPSVAHRIRRVTGKLWRNWKRVRRG
jgi:predicted O-methyltransferase YrrM